MRVPKDSPGQWTCDYCGITRSAGPRVALAAGVGWLEETLKSSSPRELAEQQVAQFHASGVVHAGLFQ